MSQSPLAFRSFVGVDLHQCTVSLSAVDPSGEETSRLKKNTKCIDHIEQWLLDLPRPSQMAVEACPFVEWFIERYRSCVDQIEIADATALALLRGKRRKTDRNDARDIAQRLARGECPLGFIADPELMQLRKLGRHWRSLSRQLSRAKHSMRSMLHAANLRGPKFDGASAQKWFLANHDLLGRAQQDAFEDFLEIVNLVERKREKLRRRILIACRSERFAPIVSRLKSVPGIAEIWGLIIAAEIGPFDRFPNADTLQFWAGMTADMKESAGRTQSGNITKAGSVTLRWALVKAAVTLCHSDARQEAIRRRLAARIGKAKANVAMGRRLLGILFAMIRDGKDYQGGPPRDRTSAANKARLRRKKKAA